MYANLLGQKAFHKLSNDGMAKIIGVSRNTFEQKMKSGRFYPSECMALCKYFNKSFEYLFFVDSEIRAS